MMHLYLLVNFYPTLLSIQIFAAGPPMAWTGNTMHFHFEYIKQTKLCHNAISSSASTWMAT